MGGLEQAIKAAKSLPTALYHLILINLILFVGLVIKEFTLLYLFGSLIFILMLIFTISKACNVWQVPDQLISEEVGDRLNEINQQWKGWIKYIETRSEASSNMSRLVTVTIGQYQMLLIGYLAAILNTNVEIFIIFNFCFMYVFMPKEIQGILGLTKEVVGGFLKKIKAPRD